MSERLTLTASIDRALAWAQGDSVRYIVATVEATAPPCRAGAPAAPPCKNLALVIDASSSMSGDKLAHAKAAARGIVGRLHDGDRLTVVSFSDDVIVHADAVTVSAQTRTALVAGIGELATRGLTNLSEGWFTAAEKVALATADGMLNRIILLSDGQANAGITDPEQLAIHAAELARRGLFTSTVGIGDGYETPVLQAIADHGGGRLHDAEHGAEIVEVVLGELGELGAVAVQNVTVTLSVPATAKAALVGSAPVTVGAGSLAVFAGTLLAGTPRTFVFRITLPAGRIDDTLLFGITARGREVAAGSGEATESLEAQPVELGFTFAEGARNSRQARDGAASLAVARAWHADILRAAARMNRQDGPRRVRAHVERELRHIERYCQLLPEASDLLREIVVLLRNADRAWDERTRKEMEMSSYLVEKTHRDFRSAPRATWSQRIERDGA